MFERLNTGRGSVDRTKETKSEAIMRIVKKSRKERDSASYRQRHPRQAKESWNDDTDTDSEEETDKASNSKSKSKK